MTHSLACAVRHQDEGQAGTSGGAVVAIGGEAGDFVVGRVRSSGVSAHRAVVRLSRRRQRVLRLVQRLAAKRARDPSLIGPIFSLDDPDARLDERALRLAVLIGRKAQGALPEGARVSASLAQVSGRAGGGHLASERVQRGVARLCRAAARVDRPVVGVQRGAAWVQRAVARRKRLNTRVHGPIARVQRPVVCLQRGVVRICRAGARVHQPVVCVPRGVAWVQQVVVRRQCLNARRH